MQYFNKSFFKMALGFAGIILLGLISLSLVNHYLQNESGEGRVTLHTPRHRA